jgi:hypothetical protein
VAAAHADLVALCHAICERETRCQTLDPADGPCEADCLRGDPDPALVRRDIVRGLVECQGPLECDANDDLCLEQVLQTLEPDFESSPLLERCSQIQDQCGGFSDDNCAYAVIFTDAGKTRLDACLNSSCDLVAGCMDELLQGT